MISLPEYWLHTETLGAEPGEWRFVLEAVGGEVELDITDVEPQMRGQRLELLAVVRGLEALDQPSRVTIVTASRYVRSGIEFGLSQWQAQGWMWESYGRLEPVKHADLWQRLDRAAAIHELHCAAPAQVIARERMTNREEEGPRYCSARKSALSAERRFDGGHGLVRRPRRTGFWGLVQALVRG